MAKADQLPVGSPVRLTATRTADVGCLASATLTKTKRSWTGSKITTGSNASPPTPTPLQKVSSGSCEICVPCRSRTVTELFNGLNRWVRLTAPAVSGGIAVPLSAPPRNTLTAGGAAGARDGAALDGGAGGCPGLRRSLCVRRVATGRRSFGGRGGLTLGCAAAARPRARLGSRGASACNDGSCMSSPAGSGASGSIHRSGSPAAAGEISCSCCMERFPHPIDCRIDRAS